MSGPVVAGEDADLRPTTSVGALGYTGPVAASPEPGGDHMHQHRVLIVATLALVAACARPLSDDRKAWVGQWRDDEATLQITADGRLAWKREAGGTTTSIAAPIQQLTDQRIVVGVWFMRTTFVVGKPPRQREDGVWTMVVDGHELLKADPLGRDPRATVVPPLEQLRKLVGDDLRRLDHGLQTDDYSEFLTHASQMYQSQFDNEKLKDGYRTWREKQVRLAPFMAGDLVLTEEPNLSHQGELTVKGRYPAVEGRALLVDASYVYSQGGWRSLGVELGLGRVKPE